MILTLIIIVLLGFILLKLYLSILEARPSLWPHCLTGLQTFRSHSLPYQDSNIFNGGYILDVMFFQKRLLTLLQLYCIFGTFCLCAMIHVFFLFQETRGKSLEEMDDVFNNESIWAFRVKEKPSRLDAEIEEAKKALERMDDTTVKAQDKWLEA